MTATTLIDLIAIDEVAPDTPTLVETAGLSVVVYRVEDRFYVTDDHCTHGPGRLHEGTLRGHEIECDFHQGCFDIRTGAVTEPPCVLPLRVYPVTLRDGRVFIEA
jgi:nitrite reductase/ring-hydroxylating ferredoxin subunit